MITVCWTIAFVVILVLAASGVMPVDQRWWAWTCAAGVVMGLFGLWYVPILQRDRARAAAARLAEAQSASESDSLESGSKTVSSTDTPGRSTRS